MLDPDLITEDFLTTIHANEKSHVDTFGASMAGISIARSTGCISLLSSAMVILIIARSSQRLSTTYHRIMFGISFNDLLVSIAVSLTTLPVPNDTIYAQIQGKLLGNKLTCELQASFIIYGTMGSFAYTLAICTYYMRNARRMLGDLGVYEYPQDSRWFEASIHFSCIAVPLVTSLFNFFAVKEILNPTPLAPFCTATPYPYWCARFSANDFNDNDPCHAFSGRTIARSMMTVLGLFYILGLFFVIGSLIITARAIFRAQVKRETIKVNRSTTRLALPDEVLERRNHDLSIVSICESKYYVTQAPRAPGTNNSGTQSQTSISTRRISICSCSHKFQFMYIQIITYIISSLTIPLIVIGRILGISSSQGYQIYHLAVRTLQGFFNFLIFLAEKMNSQRLANQDVGYLQALCNVMFRPTQDYYIFRDFDIVNEMAGMKRNFLDDMDSDYSVKSSVRFGRGPCRGPFVITDSDDDSFLSHSESKDKCDDRDRAVVSETLPLTNNREVIQEIAHVDAAKDDEEECRKFDLGEDSDSDDNTTDDVCEEFNTTFLSEQLLNSAQEMLDVSSEESYDDGIPCHTYLHANATSGTDKENTSDSCIPLSYYRGLNDKRIIQYMEDKESVVIHDYGDGTSGQGNINEFGLTTIYEIEGSDKDGSEW